MAAQAGKTKRAAPRQAPSRGVLRVAWAWLALVLGSAALNWFADIGPMAWLETRYSVATGRIAGADSLIFLLILAGPASWVLAGELERPGGGASRAPGAEPRGMFRIGAGLIGVALAFLVLASVGAVKAVGAPDGREGAVEADLARLAEDAAQRRRVALTGAPMDAMAVRFIQPAKGSSTTWTYSGFRADTSRAALAAEGPDAPPISLFVETRGRTVTTDLRYVPPEIDTVEGYLVENGLPDYARIALEQQGVRIAPTHYLLRVTDDGLRGDYYGMMFLGLFFAVVFSAVGAAVMVKAAVAG